jgi:prevent-host-death family protein
MFTSDQKGSIAEMAIAYNAIKIGIDVYRPLSDGTRYDLIFDIGGKLWRVQCKSARRHDEVVVLNCQSSRRCADGFVRRSYSPAEIDAFAAYCSELERCYFLPIAAFPHTSQIQLRLSRPLNNQRACINWADDFAFEATLAPSGAIAQLGERLHGMQEVAGSSPAGSTTVGAHEFRNHFGWYMERAASGEEIAVTRRGKPYVRLVSA